MTRPVGRRADDRTTLIAFAVMVAGIGGNVVAVKFVLREPVNPMWAGATRFLAATALFGIIARTQRATYPRGRALAGALLYGGLTIGAFFGFAYWGLQKTPAALAGVMLATVPLITFILAVAQGQERFRWDGVAGAALVVGGTAVTFGGVEGDISIIRVLAILVAAACAAQGSIVVKKFPPVHPAAMNTLGMGIGSIILFTLVPFFDGSLSLPQTAPAWTAQAYLVSAGSIGVFGLYLFVLGRWTASAVSYEFVLAPIVAIILSAWLLDERVTGAFAIGSLLVLAGVYLGALRAAPKDAPAEAAG